MVLATHTLDALEVMVEDRLVVFFANTSRAGKRVFARCWGRTLNCFRRNIFFEEASARFLVVDVEGSNWSIRVESLTHSFTEDTFNV